MDWRSRGRHLALAALALLAVRPSAAAAQELGNCKTQSLTNTGIRERQPVPDKPGVFHELVTGHVEIVCDDTHVYADEVEAYTDSEWIYLRGHVLLQEPTIRINADSGRFSRTTHLGTFNQVSGTVQKEPKPGAQKSEIEDPDMIFTGAALEKTGPKRYRLTDGQITTCTQPTPRWDLATSTAIIVPGEHVIVTNMVLRVKNVPLFYLPALYFPINKEGRSTGILPPSFGSSSLTGFALTNQFFWAINRSQDATFTQTWYKKTGEGFGGDYEYAASQASHGNISLSVVDQHATDTLAAQESYQLNSQVNQSLTHGFSLIGSTNYFSSVTSQQLYQQNLADLAQRQSTLSGTVTGGIGRYRLSIETDQSDLFNGDSSAQRSGHLPLIQFTIPDAPIGHTQIYVGMPVETMYRLDQVNVDDPTTNRSLWRSDLKPTIRVPISSLPFLNVTATGTWEVTTWSKSQDPTNASLAVAQPIWRQVLTFQTQITGPTFSRVYNTPDSGYAEKLKHVIEPMLTFAWISPVTNLNPVLQDATDYLVGGTTNVTYGVTNHLLARRKTKDGSPGQSGEILTVKISQQYSTNALAAATSSSYTGSTFNPSTAVGISNFTPVQLNATATPTDRLNGSFYLNYDAHFHGIASLGASSLLTHGIVQLTAGWSKSNLLAGDPQSFAVHTLNLKTTFKPTDRRVTGSYEFNWDIQNKVIVQQRAQVGYNSQCCGISFNYQQLGSVPGFPADRRFGVSISLAGLGSLSNPSDNSAIR